MTRKTFNDLINEDRKNGMYGLEVMGLGLAGAMGNLAMEGYGSPENRFRFRETTPEQLPPLDECTPEQLSEYLESESHSITHPDPPKPTPKGPQGLRTVAIEDIRSVAKTLRTI